MRGNDCMTTTGRPPPRECPWFNESKHAVTDGT